MNTLFKKFILVLTISMLVNTTVYADPTENNSNTTNEHIQSIEMNIEELDNNIESVMKKIDDNNKQIVDTENSIKDTETELNDTENALNKEKDLFDNRVRSMYINGFDSYLNALLQSKNINDLISNADAIKRVLTLNTNIIDRYKDKKNLISSAKESLMAKDKTLSSLKSDNEKELAQLNNNKEEQKKLLLEAAGYSSIDDQALLADALKYIENIKSKNSSVETFSSGQSPINADNIIAYASNYLGTPYVWGGTSPKPGFDCSGFTQYVYEHFGIHIKRTTYDQIKDGTEVSIDKLKPGDLVFFGTKNDPHHVGIYIGFGAYMHAPHTGDFIKISPLSRSDYLTARRVL